MKGFRFATGSVQNKASAGGCRPPAASCRPFILHPSSLILLFALTVTLPGEWATAQGITDPFQPPGALAVQAAPVEGAISPVQQLQSVIISPKRKAAIINGVLVELGGKYGDAVLTKVSEDEVVLSSDESHEVLKLYPAVEKVSSARGKRASRTSRSKASLQPDPAAGSGKDASGKQP